MQVKKKILIINNGIGEGGIERASTSLANHFSHLGYNVQICALYKTKIFYKLENNVNFIEPNFERKNLRRLNYLFHLISFVRKETKKFNPDTILAFSEWTNPYVVLALAGLKYPIFLSDRMSPMAKLPLFSEMLKRITYKYANGIIAQTEIAKKILFEKIKSTNIRVINNPVKIIKKVNCQKKKRIVTVGRLSKEKGHKYLIEAFSKINNKSWELNIVGGGSLATGYTDETKALKLLADKLGVRNRIHFYGHLNDFSLQLSESQIFVLPSLSEGFPNALIEAMAFPLACISSNFIGASEIINNNVNGLLYEKKDVNNLAQALNRLIENSDLRKKIALEGSRIKETLSFNNIAKQYLDFIFSKND